MVFNIGQQGDAGLRPIIGGIGENKTGVHVEVESKDIFTFWFILFVDNSPIQCYLFIGCYNVCVLSRFPSDCQVLDVGEVFSGGLFRLPHFAGEACCAR